MWSSAAVAHLLQGLTLLTLVMVMEWLFELLLPFYHL